MYIETIIKKMTDCLIKDISKMFVEEGCQEEVNLAHEFGMYLIEPDKEQIACIDNMWYVIHNKQLYRVDRGVLNKMSEMPSGIYSREDREVKYMNCNSTMHNSAHIIVTNANLHLVTRKVVNCYIKLDDIPGVQSYGRIINIGSFDWGVASIIFDSGIKVVYDVNANKVKQVVALDRIKMPEHIVCPDDTLLFVPSIEYNAMNKLGEFELHYPGIATIYAPHKMLMGTRCAFENMWGITKLSQHMHDLSINKAVSIEWNLLSYNPKRKYIISSLLVLDKHKTLRFYKITQKKNIVTITDIDLPDAVKHCVKDISQNTQLMQFCDGEKIAEYFIRLMNNKIYTLITVLYIDTGNYVREPILNEIIFSKP
jgi:hypothetical protein